MPSGKEPAAPSGNGLLIAMSDHDADAHILADVFANNPGAEWRFTSLHPKFRFDVPSVAHLNFYMRFFNLDRALRDRGPVSFSIAITGHTFQSPRFPSAGDMEYRRPIPEEWIVQPGRVEVSVDISPAWKAPDGETYGVLLNSIGFEIGN